MFATSPPSTASWSTRTATIGMLVLTAFAPKLAVAPPGHDAFDVEPDQLGCEGGVLIGLPLGRAIVDRDILAFDIAQLA